MHKQFTLEIERDGKLPFMDVTVHRAGNELKTNVYRKPTHSGRYLNFSSHHPSNAKRSVVQALYNRITYITTSTLDRKEEENLIRRELRENGYPDVFIRRATRRKQPPTSDSREEQTAKRPTTVIPYVAGLSETIRRILGRIGIRTAIKARKVKWMMMKGSKDKIPAEQKPGVVYAIGCSDCEKTYIGETARTAKQRAKEHNMHVRTGKTHLSAVATHAETGHTMHWQPMVVAEECHTMKRKIREALTIHKLNRNGKAMNQDTGLHLSKLWLDLV